MKFIKREWGDASHWKLHLHKGLVIMGMALAFLLRETPMHKRLKLSKVL